MVIICDTRQKINSKSQFFLFMVMKLSYNIGCAVVFS